VVVGMTEIMSARMVARWALMIVGVGAFFLMVGHRATAHSGEESYVWLQIFDETIEGRVEFPISDLNEVLDLGIPEEPSEAAAVVESNLALITGYVDAHFDLGFGAEGWPLAFKDFEILGEGTGLYVVIPFVVEGRFDPMPREFAVFYDGIIEHNPERSALLLVETDWRSGTFNNDADHLLVFESGNTEQQVVLGDTSWIGVLLPVVGLGAEHIQIGSDHILFIIALLLPAVLVFSPGLGWKPAESFGSSLWRVVKIASSFTIAHTVTLTLGGLGIVTISPDIVEPVIAISIALAALHNLRPVFFNREWVIAFVFGLFHGFGFAGFLADLGLDRSNRLVSLLGFNLGIELGQVAIILLLFPALFVLRRTRVYLPLTRIGSIALTAVATGWFVDRVFGLDVGVDRVVDPFLRWPRPLWVAGLTTIVAVVYFYIERNRDRLVPLDPEPGETSHEPVDVGVARS